MFDWNRSCSYDEQQKRRFHTTTRSRLKTLAAELALKPGSYDLRSNKAGIAVSGEITLHHDQVYIQVGQFGMSSGHGILIRACKGRKDYTGGANHFVALAMLDDIPALAVNGSDAARLQRGQAVLLRGRDAPNFRGPVYVTVSGRLLALAEVDRGEVVPKRVFNLAGLVGRAGVKKG